MRDGIGVSSTTGAARVSSADRYVVGDEVVDDWRMLHTRRDIPSAIGDEIST